jgi:E3 ubiquitin-protein ligase BRE1
MLLKSKNSRNNDGSSLLKFVKEALALRHSATVALMRSLQEAIAAQQARSESLSLALNGEKSNEGKETNIVLSLHFSLHCTF